jgi:hypothetical protein
MAGYNTINAITIATTGKTATANMVHRTYQ